MSQKTKVLHVLNARGGIDVYVRYLCQFLDSNEFETIIVRSLYDGEYVFKDNHEKALKEYRLPIIREISLLKDLHALLLLIRIIQKEKPAIIHCHSAKGGVIGRLAAKLLNIKVIYTPHAFSYLSSNSTLKKKLFLYIEKLLKIKKGKGLLLGCAKTEYQRAVKDLKYNKETASYWSNSIPKISSSSPSDDVLKISSPYACTVGRPSYQKNISSIIEAIFIVKKSIPDFHFIIMGIGHYSPEVSSLRELITKLDLKENITLVDWTDRQHIIDIVSKSLFFVSSSRYEGLPYSLLEAMMLGITPIVSKIDGHTDLVESGKNGILFDINDTSTLAKEMISVYKNTDLQIQLGKTAKNTITEDFSLPKNIEQIKSIYKKL